MPCHAMLLGLGEVRYSRPILSVIMPRSAFHQQGMVGPAVEAIPTLDEAAALTLVDNRLQPPHSPAL